MPLPPEPGAAHNQAEASLRSVHTARCSAPAQRQTPERGFCSVYPSGHCSPHQQGGPSSHPLWKQRWLPVSPGAGDPLEAAAAPAPRPRVCMLSPWVPPSTSIRLAVSGSAPALTGPPRLALARSLVPSPQTPPSALFLFLHFSRNAVPPLCLSLNSLHSRLSCSKSPKTQIALKHSDTTLAFA